MNAHTAARKVIQRESVALAVAVQDRLAGLPHGSAAQLAGHLGITKQALSGWLTGKRPLAAAHFGAVRAWLQPIREA